MHAIITTHSKDLYFIISKSAQINHSSIVTCNMQKEPVNLRQHPEWDTIDIPTERDTENDEAMNLLHAGAVIEKEKQNKGHFMIALPADASGSTIHPRPRTAKHRRKTTKQQKLEELSATTHVAGCGNGDGSDGTWLAGLVCLDVALTAEVVNLPVDVPARYLVGLGIAILKHPHTDDQDGETNAEDGADGHGRVGTDAAGVGHLGG